MKIPEKASALHMPITKNIPLDMKNAGSWWKKYKLWKFGLPKEELMEDFYQELPRKCNRFLGFNENVRVCCFIPKTFIFDGASVPKMLTSLYLPTGILYLGAFLHDFMYGFEGLIVFTEEMKEFKFVRVVQKEADNIFYEMNMAVNDFKTACYPAYTALRMFGFKAWKDDQKKKSFVELFPEYASLWYAPKILKY